MTTTANRWGRVTVLGALAVLFSDAGCGRGLLGISSSETPDAGAPDVAGAVPPGASVCFADHPASCDDTCREATRVLYTNCASCHSGPAPRGLPPWGFLLDPAELITATWARQGVSPLRFVDPGSPNTSAIYARAVIRKDMPPLQTDVTQPYYPRVSDADSQILHDWISSCMGSDPVDAATDVAPPPPDPSLPHVVACPAGVPGGACAIEQQSCAYPTSSCVCSQGSWTCDPCPVQQPSRGDYCDRRRDGSDTWAVRCRYAGVTCSCLDQGIPYSTWECGACPAGEPTNGQACGNSRFSCDYGDDTCQCTVNGWSCATTSCPLSSTQLLGSCSGETCVYPSLGQSCSCQNARWSCSCPAALPVDGSECLGAQPESCSYSDKSCTCVLSGPNSATWHCMASCPATQPTAGAACTSSLSCSYASQLCYCDGQHWNCS